MASLVTLIIALTLKKLVGPESILEADIIKCNSAMQRGVLGMKIVQSLGEDKSHLLEKKTHLSD